MNDNKDTEIQQQLQCRPLIQRSSAGLAGKHQQIATTAVQTVFNDFPSVGFADVAIYWDYENVKIPAWCPATTASEGIRKKVAKYGRIVEKRLYYDSRQPAESLAPRSELDLSGFTLVDCPSRNRKETLDKKLIVDMLCFAWERASLGAKACVVLITSDGDYSYALARLRDIGVFTVIIYKPDNVAKVLIDNANVVMSWEFDVLGGVPQSQDDDIDFEEESIELSSIVTDATEVTSASNRERSCIEQSTLANGVVNAEILASENNPDVDSNQKINAMSHESTGLLSEKLLAMAKTSMQPKEELLMGEVVPTQFNESSKSADEKQHIQESTQTKQPTPQTRSKFALFCSVVLNAQHRNVKEGISVYSSWADEGNTAATFYTKVGEKDRKSYLDIRSLATQKGFVEWGRRNLGVAGKPVIKIRDRDDRPDGSSPESYLRLTYSGLSVINPNTETKAGEWQLVLPPKWSTKKDSTMKSDSGSIVNQEPSKAPITGKLFVGGLAWQTTEDSLRSYFIKFGPLKHVVVVEGRGFGFLFYQNPDDAKRCLSKAGHHVVDERSVDVKLYQRS